MSLGVGINIVMCIKDVVLYKYGITLNSKAVLLVSTVGETCIL